MSYSRLFFEVYKSGAAKSFLFQATMPQSIDLNNIVWYRYKLELNGELTPYWWPAIYFPSHREGLDHAYASSYYSNLEVNGKHPYPIDSSTDPAMEAQLTCNMLQETINPKVKIPMVSLLVPNLNKQPDSPDLARRHIPLTITDERSIRHGQFLRNLLELMKIQTEKNLGELFPAYNESLSQIKYLISSSRCVNSTISPIAASSVSAESILDTHSTEQGEVVAKVTTFAEPETETLPSQAMAVNEPQNSNVTKQESCELELEPQRPDIDCMECWSDVLIKLRFCGWLTRPNKHGEICYVRTHMEPSSVENVDYFKSEEAVHDFLRREFEWKWTPEVEERIHKEMMIKKITQKKMAKSSKTIDKKAKSKAKRVSIGPEDEELSGSPNKVNDNVAPVPKTPSIRTKPQDPGIPLPTDPSDKCSSASSLSSWNSLDSTDKYTWRVLWEHLKRKGWTHVKAKHILHDWYYLRPHCDPVTGKPGEDFFLSATEVIKFVRDQDSNSSHHPGSNIPRSKGTAGSKPCRSSEPKNGKRKNSEKNGPRKCLKLDVYLSDASPVQKTSNFLDGSHALLSTEIKSRSQQSGSSRTDISISTKSKDSATSRKSSKKDIRLREQHWWKFEAIPSSEDIYPILTKLGYINDHGAISLPEGTMADAPKFKSLSGLRKYLCWRGIPNFDEDSSKLPERELKLLLRWVKFANVPVDGKHSIECLSSVSSPKNDDTLLPLLYKFKFSNVDEKIYVPFSDRLGRVGRVHKTHFFNKSELQTELRSFVRKSWQLGLTPTDMKKDSATGSFDSLCFVPGAEQISGLSDDALLQVRLWAAASSSDLPKFQNEDKEPSTHYLEELVDFEGTRVKNNKMPQAKGSVDEKQPAEKESQNDKIKTTSNVNKQKPTDTHLTVPKKQLPWYKIDEFPDFNKKIWPILQKFDFTWTGGLYSHPLYPRNDFQTSGKDLQSYICRHGIPDFEKISENLNAIERDLLHRWISFAHVPGINPKNSLLLLQSVEIPEHHEIRSLLSSKFDFQITNDKFYPPYPPGTSHNNEQQICGIHFFEGLENVREFIRGSPKMRIETGNSPRDRKPKKYPDEELVVRLWAALSPRPIPTFIIPPHYTTNTTTNDDSCSSHQDDSTLTTNDDVSPNEKIVTNHPLFTQEEPINDNVSPNENIVTNHPSFLLTQEEPMIDDLSPNENIVANHTSVSLTQEERINDDVSPNEKIGAKNDDSCITHQKDNKLVINDDVSSNENIVTNHASFALLTQEESHPSEHEKYTERQYVRHESNEQLTNEVLDDSETYDTLLFDKEHNDDTHNTVLDDNKASDNTIDHPMHFSINTDSEHPPSNDALREDDNILMHDSSCIISSSEYSYTYASTGEDCTPLLTHLDQSNIEDSEDFYDSCFMSDS